jgi:hypothetical protein
MSIRYSLRLGCVSLGRNGRERTWSHAVDGNNVDRGPLAGWVVIMHGRTLIGRRTPDDRLSPVYELIAIMQMVQTGPKAPPELVTARQVLPLLTSPSIKSIPFPREGIEIPISCFSAKERRELASAVESCEQLMTAMRAQDSGIVIAPPGSRVKQP